MLIMPFLRFRVQLLVYLKVKAIERNRRLVWTKRYWNHSDLHLHRANRIQAARRYDPRRCMISLDLISGIPRTPMGQIQVYRRASVSIWVFPERYEFILNRFYNQKMFERSDLFSALLFARCTLRVRTRCWPACWRRHRNKPTLYPRALRMPWFRKFPRRSCRAIWKRNWSTRRSHGRSKMCRIRRPTRTTALPATIRQTLRSACWRRTWTARHVNSLTMWLVLPAILVTDNRR